MNETVLQLVKNTNLIEYIPGQLGTFIHAFLESHPTVDILRNRKDAIGRNLVGVCSNKEWQIFDYLYISQCKEYDTMFTDRPVYDRFLMYSKIVQQYIRTVVGDNAYNKPLYEYLLDLNNNDFHMIDQEEFDLSNQIFEYHRTHSIDHMLPDKDILPWKSKHYTLFPKDKFWISVLLLLYKHQHYFESNNLNILSKKAKHAVAAINNKDDLLLAEHKHLYTLSNFRRYNFFNLYDLIFNKNIDNLESIVTPHFKFNAVKKEMLDTVHTDSIDILKFYGLTHDIKVPLEDTFEFLRTNKIVMDSINRSKK